MGDPFYDCIPNEHVVATSERQSYFGDGSGACPRYSAIMECNYFDIDIYQIIFIKYFLIVRVALLR